MACHGGGGHVEYSLAIMVQRNQRWVGEALEIAVNLVHTFSNLAMEFMEVQKSN